MIAEVLMLFDVRRPRKSLLQVMMDDKITRLIEQNPNSFITLPLVL